MLDVKELKEEIMKLIRDMAHYTDIEIAIENLANVAFWQGYEQANREMEE